MKLNKQYLLEQSNLIYTHPHGTFKPLITKTNTINHLKYCSIANIDSIKYLVMT